MSKRDDLHHPLRRALERDGWTITADPLQLVLGDAILKADLGAEKTFAAEKAGRKIAVEVKDFDTLSPVSELEKTMGQLQLYQWALDEQEPDRELFLALSEEAYHNYFHKPVFEIVVTRTKIKLIVFDQTKEEILLWLSP
jgi:hypothetical protein